MVLPREILQLLIFFLVLEIVLSQLLNCTRHTNISFIPENEMMKRSTPLLLSFPGSGNSWTRKLLEYATGHYTGSVLPKDKVLWQIYESEKYCGRRQVAIKAHPAFVALRRENDTILNPFEVDLLLGLGKCKKGLIHSFKRVLMLVRDPYDSIVANFNLERTRMNHTGLVSQQAFNLKDFMAFLHKGAQGFNASFHHVLLPMLKMNRENNKTDVHVVMYSDLIDKNKRYEVMENILSYLQFSNEDKEKTICAFELAEDKRIHRNYSQPNITSTSFIYNCVASYLKSIPAKKRVKDCISYKLLEDFNVYFGYPLYPSRYLSAESNTSYEVCSSPKLL